MKYTKSNAKIWGFLNEIMNHELNKTYGSDEYYTIDYAVSPIIDYIKNTDVIWCPFDKKDSAFVRLLKKNGNPVIYGHIDTGQDFFNYTPDVFDVIISNPPYSLRTKILNRLFDIKKPFALLINESGLFGSFERFELLRSNDFELMIFNKRINYIKNGRVLKSPPFKSVYLCSKLLPEKILFKKI